jgi:adenosine 3'-phospho 5'-phosphosulfate transporter B2
MSSEETTSTIDLSTTTTTDSSVLSSYRSEANLADIIFALSVNFLLYVLLIIVFYMIVRFYLEEEVTSNYKSGGYSAVSQNEDEESELELEAETGEGEDGIEGVVTVHHRNKQAAQQKKKNQEGGLIEEDVEPHSGHLEMSKIYENNAKRTDYPVSPPKSFSGPPAIQKPTSSSSTSTSSGPKSPYFLNLHDFTDSQETGTKQEVIQQLVVCSIGLVVSFTIWGLVQERILTQTYDDEYFVFSYGLVFMNRLFGVFLSLFLMYYYSVPWFPSALWEYSFPSVANMLSSWCQYEALKYVSFPVVMLSKAFKMIPIMLMGKFMNNKNYEGYEYVCGGLVGFGLYLFLSSSETLDLTTNVFGAPENIKGAMCGVILLILFLFFDSFTGQWQTRMFTLNAQLSPLQMMLIMNCFSTVFSFITLVHQEELYNSQIFIYHHPQMIFHLILFAISSTVGQLFIFYTVKQFGAVVFSIIMSLRILFSTLLSCFVYNHPITEMGFLGIIVVCLATGYRLMKKTEGKPLIRWKDSTVEQSGNIFKEWHEHLDI